MDDLKALVIDDPNARPNQVSIVAASVNLLHDLKGEVSQLKQKLAAMEVANRQEQTQQQLAVLQRHHTESSTGSSHNSDTQIVSPLQYIMPSMNASGISVWRLHTSGTLLEVNMVFEMLSGHRNSTLVGKAPWQAPIYGCLSNVPQSFLRLFFNDAHLHGNEPSVAQGTENGTHNNNLLLQHLEHIPPNHALKLLSRWQSAWGTTIEALTALTLVRDRDFKPAYLLALHMTFA